MFRFRAILGLREALQQPGSVAVSEAHLTFICTQILSNLQKKHLSSLDVLTIRGEQAQVLTTGPEATIVTDVNKFKLLQMLAAKL